MKKISRKSFLQLTAVSAAAAALAACSSSAQQTTTIESTSESTSTTASSTDTTVEDDKVIKFGAICSMTGASALYGEGAQNALTMAVEEINAAGGEYTVEMLNSGVVADDASDSKQAINAYNSIMSEGPEAILGCFFSSVTLPIAEQATTDGMLVLATGATNTEVTLKGPTIFRNCFIDPYQGKMAAQFVTEQGWSKAGIIYAKDDDYSNGLKDAFIESATEAGIEIVYTGECTTTDTDYSAQTSQVVANGADFLYYPCFQDTVPLLVGAARDAGFAGAIMGGDGWDGADTNGMADDFADCYFTNHYSSEDTAEAVASYVTKYTERFGADTLTACSALYYDGLYMLVQAAELGGGSDTASMVEGMTGMTFTGVGGTFTLDENGDAPKSVVINTYEEGEVKWLMTLAPEA